MMPKTFKDLEQYVVNHPLRAKVFTGMTNADILLRLHKASQQGTMAWYAEDDEIKGVVMAEKIVDESEPPILWINQMLVSSKKALKWFILYFLKNFPDYILMAKRRNKVVTYKTSRLCQLILTYKTQPSAQRTQ